MSITRETLQKHFKDPAIFCCQRKKGLVISEADLEDPTLFDDMVDAGLLTLSEDGLSIEQVIGTTLMEDCDALTPIKAKMLDKVNDTITEEKIIEKKGTTEILSQEEVCNVGGNGMIHIKIDKLEGLSLDIPTGSSFISNALADTSVTATTAKQKEDKIIRTLTKRIFKVTDVVLGEKTTFQDGILTMDRKLVEKAVTADSLVKKINIDIIRPEERHV